MRANLDRLLSAVKTRGVDFGEFNFEIGLFQRCNLFLLRESSNLGEQLHVVYLGSMLHAVGSNTNFADFVVV
jgi:hypothetical protein